MVDDDDAAAAIQTLVEIAQLNPTQARNALKHYGNSLENAVNAFFNGSLPLPKPMESDSPTTITTTTTTTTTTISLIEKKRKKI